MTSRAGYTEVTSRGFQLLSLSLRVYLPASNSSGSFPSDAGRVQHEVFHVLLVSKRWRREKTRGTRAAWGGGAVWDRAAAWPANEGGAGSSHRLREDRLSPQVDRREENHLQV